MLDWTASLGPVSAPTGSENPSYRAAQWPGVISVSEDFETGPARSTSISPGNFLKLAAFTKACVYGCTGLSKSSAVSASLLSALGESRRLGHRGEPPDPDCVKSEGWQDPDYFANAATTQQFEPASQHPRRRRAHRQPGTLGRRPRHAQLPPAGVDLRTTPGDDARDRRS